MEYFLLAFKKAFDFQGRARRKEYWMFILFIVISSLSLSFLVNLLAEDFFRILIVFYIVVILIPLLSVTIRRLHDTGRSGGYIFIRFIPLIGNIWLLSLMCQKGDATVNKYGPNPKKIDTELEDIGKPQE